MAEEILHRTRSVCPVCLQPVPAERVRIGTEVFLRKACETHGSFSSVIWRGRLNLAEWIGGVEGDGGLDARCPEKCGLCPDHLQQTCCVLLEVTSRCNLRCRFCFASGGGECEPTLGELKSSLRRLADPGETLVQVSGGEPTLRDDLPEVVAAAREAGCRYVQLNSNGIRLAEDAAYLKALADAGLSFVFMQFDGTDDLVYQHLRGRPLLQTKRKAIENCAAVNVGVTLVPTLVPGLNTSSVGQILRFAVSQSPAVRGVHFQPVSYFGRIPATPSNKSRLTLDELVAAIEEQAGGLLRAEHLLPSRCDHPLCGFHGDFVVTPDGGLLPLSKRSPTAAPGCCCGTTAEQNREFVARRWRRPAGGSASCCGDMRDMDAFLERTSTHGFTVTAMAFQDAGSLDAERLRRCSLHVFDDGRLVPFCAYYLSGWPR